MRRAVGRVDSMRELVSATFVSENKNALRKLVLLIPRKDQSHFFEVRPIAIGTSCF